MAFKVPLLPKLSKPKVSKTREYSCLPVTNISTLDITKTVGKGSYGLVKLCKKNDNFFIIKELLVDDDESDDEDDGIFQKLFLKEAKVLNSLKHENIVKFDSIVEPEDQKLTAYLMEYIKFDFNVLNLDHSISSLKELLSVLNKVDYKGYEHFQEIIAKDISAGLAYLHQRGIVHRDLKPENVLVSNQHYDSTTLELFWEKRPLIAKLTDFGEARTNVIQTSSLVHTKTNRVARGSPVYMAPEIHNHDGVTQFTVEDFKRTDIWSFSMVLFMLLNPDLKYPYFQDVNNLVKAGVSGIDNIMKNVVSKKELPNHGSKYKINRQEKWQTVLRVYQMCASLHPDGRPSAEQILLQFEVDYSLAREEKTVSDDASRINKNSDRNLFEEFQMKEDVTTPEKHDNASNDIVVIEVSEETLRDTARNQNQESCHKTEKRTEGTDDNHSTSEPPQSKTVAVDPEDKISNETAHLIRRHVSGNFHQASAEIFSHNAAGSQCSSICIASMIAAAIFPAAHWDSDDLDQILLEGDRLHLKILAGKGWPSERLENKLGIDEMPATWRMQIHGKEPSAQVAITMASYDLAESIEALIAPALQREAKSPCIVRLYDAFITILPGENNSHYIFDPHARSCNGMIDPNGASCLLHFNTSVDLIQFLKGQVRGSEQVDVFQMSVSITAVADVITESETSKLEDMYATDYAEGALEDEDENDGTEESNGSYPIYEKRERGLSVYEIVSICTDSNIDEERICASVPYPKSNSIFVISLNDIHEKDLSCDDSGPYDKHSSPTHVIDAKYDNDKLLTIETISRKPLPKDSPILKRKGVYTVKRLYSERVDRFGRGKMTRIISRVSSCNGLEKVAIIQYLGIENSAFKPHGNSKDKKRTYVRTKPSVIEKEKLLLRNEPPKKVIRLIEDEKGGPLNMASASDGPRDRRQCYNIKASFSNKKRSRNTGPVAAPNFDRLIASMDAGQFIRNVDFSFRIKHNRIHPNTFAITENAVTCVQSFCSPYSSQRSQLGIDMTYKVGPFYTTCLSFAHPYFVHRKNPQIHPTIFAGMMTSTGRQEQDYRYLANQLKSCGINRLIYGTDGELALEMGFESVFPIDCMRANEKNIKLRCFTHVKDDMLAALKKIPESKGRENHIIEGILGREMNGERFPGLVDSDDNDFLVAYERLAATWPKQFKDYVESENMRVRPLKDTFLKSMGKQVRIEAGLGNPPNKFDNQRAESINNILKEAIGNTFVDQSAVHDLIFENVIKPQENEMVKAFYGSGEYRLVDFLQHYEVSNQRWKNMTECQKRIHTNKVLRCSIDEIRPERIITKKLSVQPEDCGDRLRSMPPALVNRVWSQAEILLSNDPVRELQSGNFCITEDDRAFIVRQERNMFICTCTDYQKLNLCPHVLVVADAKHCIEQYISRYNYNPSGAVNRHNTKGAGEKRVKKPRRGSQNIQKLPIVKYKQKTTSAPFSLGIDQINLKEKRPFQFCEIWHNDETFRVIYVSSTVLKSRKELKCATCGNTISRSNAVAPFDVLISHRERIKYPQTNNEGHVEWKPTRSKMVIRVYCMKRRCLLRRHPYFWLGMLNIDDIVLTEAHRELLNEEFGYEFN